MFGFNKEQRKRIVKTVRKVEGDRITPANIAVPSSPVSHAGSHNVTVEIIGDKDSYGFYPAKVVYRNLEFVNSPSQGGQWFYLLDNAELPDCVAYTVDDGQSLEKRRYEGKVTGRLGYGEKEHFAAVEVDPGGKGTCSWCADRFTAGGGVQDLLESYQVNYNGVITAYWKSTVAKVPAKTGWVGVLGSIDVDVQPESLSGGGLGPALPWLWPALTVYNNPTYFTAGGLYVESAILVCDPNGNILGSLGYNRTVCAQWLQQQAPGPGGVSNQFLSGDVDDYINVRWRRQKFGWGKIEVTDEDRYLIWASSVTYVAAFLGAHSNPALLRLRSTGGTSFITWGTDLVCGVESCVPDPTPWQTFPIGLPPPVPANCTLAVSITPSQPAGTYPSRTPITFDSTISGAVGNVNVVWDFGDGTTSNAEDPGQHIFPDGTYTARVTVTDQNNCKATASVVYTFGNGVIAPTPVDSPVTITNGMKYVSADTSTGDVAVVADAGASDVPIGQETVLIKSDSSGNTLSVSPASGSTIGGSSVTRLYNVQWSGIVIQKVSSTAFRIVKEGGLLT
jgi:hypothetical protein